MKGFYTIVIAAVLIVALVVGWVSLFAETGSETENYEENIRLADSWFDEGLYQRAILKYQSALEQKPTLELCQKLIAAYEGRYQETDEIIGDYRAALRQVLELYPDHVNFVRRLAELYLSSGNYQDAYDCLCEGEQNGASTPELQQMKLTARYAVSLKGRTFTDYKEPVSAVYTVTNGYRWGTYSLDGSGNYQVKYVYANQVGPDGVILLTDEKDSRLINVNGMVLGIFDFPVAEAGVFSDGLIPVLRDGKYAYYDEFAKPQFGDYDWAGAFRNGIAPVQKNGKWLIIDQSGNTLAEFADIVVTPCGFCTYGGVCIAAKTAGSYALYNSNWEQVGSFQCEAADFCTADGLIAFRSNGKWGFVNTQGKVVIEPQYEAAKSFSYGLAAVCCDDKWGFINTENTLVIPCAYTDAGYFHQNGECMVRTDVPEEASPSENTAATEETTDGDESEEKLAITWQILALNLGIVGG